MSTKITKTTTPKPKAPSAPTKAPGTPADKGLQARWGKELIAAGWTALPDVIFQCQKALKLNPVDVLILLHLASYWWKPNENPWPAKGTIADAINVSPRTVQRAIARMEKLGYVKRIARIATAGDNMSNEYDLRGLIKAAKPLAIEKIDRKEKRAAEDKQRRQTPAAFALVKGGKKD
ncbi:helix-turn-helix domain-containing protein [Pandoraea commovens]|uniref:Helix-turn-helix domain-containing protein n=1 Tax=Pandoraea commovens TaxID=2508289 RepID=A0ABY5QHA9_9BURK|nr:helix-turn-helix domain-containing protein [Pandoraea commovens]UVA79994.1 helix-turn-helix domain-containing protein [Pandoraea commovens]